MYQHLETVGFKSRALTPKCCLAAPVRCCPWCAVRGQHVTMGYALKCTFKVLDGEDLCQPGDTFSEGYRVWGFTHSGTPAPLFAGQ